MTMMVCTECGVEGDSKGMTIWYDSGSVESPCQPGTHSFKEKNYCDYFVKDGVTEGVDWCGYSEDLENRPKDPHKCGILDINPGGL